MYVSISHISVLVFPLHIGLAMSSPLVVLITGCSSGVGLATATYLAKESEHNFKVYATVKELSDISDLEEAAGDSKDKSLFIRELDVTKKVSVRSAVAEILRANDKIDVVINNAGIVGLDFDLYDESSESLDIAQEIMNVNLWGPARVMQAVLPSMKSHQSGHLINITSGVGVKAFPFLGFYSASKFALEGMSEGLAVVLQKCYGIRTSIIELGAVSTQLKKKGEESLKNADICLNLDNTTSILLKELAAKVLLPAMDISRHPREIGQFIEKVILSNESHLRYQSDEHQTKHVASMLVDPTGDSVIKINQGALNCG
ncbi:retinol dehydrogenase 8-like [Asterias amurensis]|uniref:retinol dehydrogenase 8-like n=1 Tax=Asterias amurensis TaxID=7602 RepID=UPI003AB34DC2